MKNSFKALSLSLLLAAPVTLSLPAQAQVSLEPGAQVWQQVQQQFPVLQLAEVATPALVVEQGVVADNDHQAIRAFGNSQYTYWDARVLANFWGNSVMDAKTYMGRKLLAGMHSKALLEQHVLDARVKALANVEDLKLFYDAGYGYEDAADLADFWGDSTPWQTKMRIERNIIMGNNQGVRRALTMARDRG